VLPLRHGLSDMDDRLDGLVEYRLDVVKVRLNDDLWDDEHDICDEEWRRSVGASGNSRGAVT